MEGTGTVHITYHTVACTPTMPSWPLTHAAAVTLIVC
jgi:hypothetical protein